MGLQLVGLVVVSEFKDPPIISYHMSYLAKLQKKIGKHFIIISAHPDMGKCSLEGYQFSSQFLDLVESNFFVQSNDYSHLKSDKSAFLYTKLTNEFDVYYFLVNVAIVSRDSWFPRSWFPYQSLFPTIADFSDVMRRGYNIASPNYVRLLDFNLLMFLDAIFDQSLPVIIDCCIKKKKLPIEIETKIEEMIYESIPMFV
ncbi:hypothetical protein GPJ56_004944 [Histomonas meleagridis]|uniref:uncharacterized protein n=1 Tax=Histomonas meleagridis TaxID=135588 RepID=UPI003559DADF|nr:hypothetical protein GPJ56_004944 [Histomonas meleagridis]KAH0798530.1 hypothetical protein GO595_008395 [Histomonas meleagridis]